MKVEPTIGQDKPCFVYHFPASQAALAQICEHDTRVAGRFELYYKNMELRLKVWQYMLPKKICKGYKARALYCLTTSTNC